MGTVQIADTPRQVECFRMLAIRGRLKLEAKGIRFKGSRSTLAEVKRQYGMAGRPAEVLHQFESLMRERGYLPC